MAVTAPTRTNYSFDIRTHVSAENWREVSLHWAKIAMSLGWQGRVRSFLEVGHFEIYGQEVDDEFCASRVADLIIECFQLAKMEGIDLWR